MAVMKIGLDLKTSPAFCTMERRSWRERTFDLSSCDLWKQGTIPIFDYNPYARRLEGSVF
jgi:hypothetical protein